MDFDFGNGMNVFFVSGIDTNAGKSYATGYIAGIWNRKGIRTITQKFIQTGNTGISEDIELHRRIMGCPLLPEPAFLLPVFAPPARRCNPLPPQRLSPGSGRRIHT